MLQPTGLATSVTIKVSKYIETTVWAHIEPRGSIFQNKVLGGVLLIFDLGGVVIKMGFC